MVHHDKYSPSALEVLELCPCFEQDKSQDNTAALDGSRLHEAVETNDLSLCENEEEEAAVTTCLAVQKEILEAYGEFAAKYNELHMDIEDLTNGTADLLVVKEFGADLVDWKFGRMPVTEASNNIQLGAYVLGVFTKFPEVREVRATIVAPRQDIRSAHVYKMRVDAPEIRKRIKDIIAKCEDPDKVEAAHEKACRFCGRKAVCPRLAETALQVSSNLGLPMPIEFEPGRILKPEDRAKAQVLSYILEDWAKKIREYNAKAVLEDGISIPGFSLRSRKGSTSVVDMLSAVETVLKKVPELRMNDVLQACNMSLPKLADQIYAKLLDTKKKETKKAVRDNLNAMLEEHVSVPETVTFLQRERGKTNDDIIQEAR